VPTGLRIGGFQVVVFLRSVSGMRTPDVIRAFRLVEEHTELLLAHWRKYHG
jgi:hypothetical protein